MKILKLSAEENIWDFGIENELLDLTSEAQSMKKKSWKFDLIKMKNFVLQKFSDKV